jgi:transposase
MDGVVEIITGRERRRRWSTEEKRRIVEESMEPGAVMRAVAARNGICESLLYAWRRQMREGTLHETEAAAFVPVRVL